MCTLANSEDPDEMQQDAAFHLGLLCLQGQTAFSVKPERHTILFGSYNL